MLEPPLISADILLKSLANVTFFSSFESDEICLVRVLRGVADVETDPDFSVNAVSLKLVIESVVISFLLSLLSDN